MILRALSLQIKSYDSKEEFVLFTLKWPGETRGKWGQGLSGDRQKVGVGECRVGNICNSVN